MSDNNVAQAETTTEERKPPTLADIVREKTDDGARIIAFFLDVMEDRVEGAKLCHRIDAAKQLDKHRSKAAAEFLAEYGDAPCGHALRPKPGSADTCSATAAAGRANAPGPLTQDFLTVLSAMDQELMTRLVRAQTADGGTVVEFLDDVMEDRLDGFKCHHRIAAAKELIVHIVRDEQPVLSTAEGPEPVPGSAPARNEAQDEPDWMSWPWDYRHAIRFALETPREALAKVEADPEHPLHRYFKLDRDVRESLESVGAVIGPDGLLTSRDRIHPVPPAPAEGSQPETNDSEPEKAEEGKDERPAPVDLTPAERRIREKLKAHWHEPDTWDGPIDSAHPGRSPPW